MRYLLFGVDGSIIENSIQCKTTVQVQCANSVNMHLYFFNVSDISPQILIFSNASQSICFSRILY